MHTLCPAFEPLSDVLPSNVDVELANTNTGSRVLVAPILW